MRSTSSRIDDKSKRSVARASSPSRARASHADDIHRAARRARPSCPTPRASTLARSNSTRRRRRRRRRVRGRSPSRRARAARCAGRARDRVLPASYDRTARVWTLPRNENDAMRAKTAAMVTLRGHADCVTGCATTLLNTRRSRSRQQSRNHHSHPPSRVSISNFSCAILLDR